MVVNVAEFLFETSNTDFLSRLSPNPLPPGQCLGETFGLEINACETATYQAGIRVEASPPNGNSCQDKTDISLNSTGAPPRPSLPPSPKPTQRPTLSPTLTARVDCSVDVALSCVLVDGQPCTSAATPDTAMCDVGQAVQTITLGYTGRGCDELGNSQADEAQCSDEAPIVFVDPVSIQCQTMAGEFLVVVPESVRPGGTVVISSASGVLPPKIACRILDGEGKQLQENRIDTSGTVRLDLGDSFGSLRLDACRRDNEELSCLQSLAYQADISNIGPVNMTVQQIEFVFNGQAFDLLRDISQNPLGVGQSTSLAPTLEINVCDVNELIAVVNVRADPPNGSVCQDGAELRYVYHVG